MTKPYGVVFAGVPGCGKTPIAFYLSGRFGLPMFNNDQLRYEVQEDLLVDNINIPEALAEFEKRLTARVDQVLSTGRSVIIDGSVDRRWPERKEQLLKHGYDWFLIDLELSKNFLVNLFNKTGRAAFATTKLDRYLAEHERFLADYSSEINFYIHDHDFARRNEIVASALEKYLENR